MPRSPHSEDESHKDAPGGAAPQKALHISAWNLLLLVPIFMVFTPMFNFDSPRLFGMPFYYWFQFAWVPVGVICVGVVYFKTKDTPTAPREREIRR
jgi:hypothetical protein